MTGLSSSTCRAALIGLWLALRLAPAPAQSSAAAGSALTDGPVLEARDAARKRDRSRLAAAKAAAQAVNSPLLPWVEYWDLSSRLTDAQADEVEAFYVRWRGSYVEDRLRNDWLRELGRRRDWAAIARDFPRFRMNDDREVTCYALLTEHLAGRDVRDAARAAWLAQRDADDGCALMARRSVDINRPRAARQAVAIMGAPLAKRVGDALDTPPRYLAQHATAATR